MYLYLFVSSIYNKTRVNYLSVSSMHAPVYVYLTLPQITESGQTGRWQLLKYGYHIYKIKGYFMILCLTCPLINVTLSSPSPVPGSRSWWGRLCNTYTHTHTSTYTITLDNMLGASSALLSGLPHLLLVIYIACYRFHIII